MKSFSFLLNGSIVDPRGTRRIDHASRGERAVWAASYLLQHPMRIPGALCRETHARPIKFRFNKSTRLETRVTESPVGTKRTNGDALCTSAFGGQAEVTGMVD